MTTEKLNLRTLDGGAVDIDLSLLETIPDKGRLLPGEPGFDEATLIWNGMIQREPPLVIQPEDSDDVVEAVALARDHRLVISIKGGGHNIAGLGLADGGLTLDMSRMKWVNVDRDQMLVKVGPGCLLGDVDRSHPGATAWRPLSVSSPRPGLPASPSAEDSAIYPVASGSPSTT